MYGGDEYVLDRGWTSVNFGTKEGGATRNGVRMHLAKAWQHAHIATSWRHAKYVTIHVLEEMIAGTDVKAQVRCGYFSRMWPLASCDADLHQRYKQFGSPVYVTVGLNMNRILRDMSRLFMRAAWVGLCL